MNSKGGVKVNKSTITSLKKSRDFLDSSQKVLDELETNYSDVHNGPYMKISFQNIDYSKWFSKPIALILNFLFKNSLRIQLFKKKYGEDFPVYGLLSQTTQYKNITLLMVNFIKRMRLQEKNIPKITLEIHTGTGNASSEYLIPQLITDLWVITDREKHNLKNIQRALGVNNKTKEYLGKNKIVSGIFDLAHKNSSIENSRFKSDEIIAHFGAYFGNETQSIQALKRLNSILNKKGLIFFSCFTDPHERMATIKNFSIENLKGKFLLQSLIRNNVLLTLLYALFTKATTASWSEDITSKRLFLFNKDRLKKMCAQTGFELVDAECFTQKLQPNASEKSNVWGFCLKKIDHTPPD